MSWKPQLRPTPTSTASQWPKAVGSRPVPAQSPPLAAQQSKATESLGAYTYYSQGNPGTGASIQSQRRVRYEGKYRPNTGQQHEQAPIEYSYRPVTPPTSPPPSPAAGQHHPVSVTRRVVSTSSQMTHATGDSSQTRVSPSIPSRSTSPRCICHREHCKILCYVCRETQTGRVRLQCPEHPNTIHLMDYDRCPECKAVNLTELRSRPN